ncbi:variable surface lipoprotein [Mycoplasmopsis bovis]|uniref:variable surface lipoprotein n=1 Tax=Mycoplasmopsis bovis TaxID=28903 RepID=UPI00094B28EB|nr:variable surface lipoprotein [Mycoplasmopsis bovis]
MKKSKFLLLGSLTSLSFVPLISASCINGEKETKNPVEKNKNKDPASSKDDKTEVNGMDSSSRNNNSDESNSKNKDSDNNSMSNSTDNSNSGDSNSNHSNSDKDTLPINADTMTQPPAENSSSSSENLDKNDEMKKFALPKLYEFSERKDLFTVVNKEDALKELTNAYNYKKNNDHALRIRNGKLNISTNKKTIFKSFILNPELKESGTINTHGSVGTNIGYKGFKNKTRKGILLEKISDKKFKITWQLILDNGKFDNKKYFQEFDFS